MENNPNYFSILTADVRYNEELPPNTKLLFSEITALCNLEGYCWAGNEYFANLYKVTNETVSRWISQLLKLGFLRVEYDKRGFEIIQRRLYIVLPGSVDKNINGSVDKIVNPSIDKKIKDNNTMNITISIHPLQKFITESLPNVVKLKKQITNEECENLLAKYPKEMIYETLLAMENYKPLNSSYQSVYLTLNNWLKIREKKNGTQTGPNGSYQRSPQRGSFDKDKYQRLLDNPPE